MKTQKTKQIFLTTPKISIFEWKVSRIQKCHGNRKWEDEGNRIDHNYLERYNVNYYTFIFHFHIYALVKQIYDKVYIIRICNTFYCLFCKGCISLYICL